MTIHTLKCWPDFFKPIISGTKTFDLRKDDRAYAVGDDLVLCEFRPGVGEYTGRTRRMRITYILREFDGLLPGYCVLQLVPLGPVTTDK